MTDYQTIAADANQDGNIYTYDATLIARYAVGLSKLPTSYVGEWVFVPDSIRYEPLDSDKTDQDFVGVLIGDVNGGWNPSESLPRREIMHYTQLEDMVALPGEKIVIPVFVEDDQEMISCDVTFKYDQEVLKFMEVTKTELTQEFELLYNVNQGKLKVGVYGVNPINKTGESIKLIFEVIGRPGQRTLLSLDRYQTNDGPVRQAVAICEITGGNELPKSFLLEQNYPNPFPRLLGWGINGSETVIRYQLPRSGEIVVEIFDLLGQHVRTLVDGAKDAGYYQIVWDGKNKMGKDV